MECIRLMEMIYGCLEMDLCATEVSVLLNISRFAVEKGQPIPASRNRIAAQSRLASSTVDRCLGQLIKKGYLLRAEDHTATKAAKYVINEKRLTGEE